MVSIAGYRLERRTLVALLVATVFFMENLDATVIGTALPAIAADFHTIPLHLSVGVSAYLVALTVFIPLSGWAVDRFGARRIFTSAIVIFTLASLLCARCETLVSFTAARFLQGAGGAMMVPVGRLVVLRDTPKEGIVRAIATLTWPALAAPMLGPPLGGWVSTHWGWHWIFLLNLPLGALTLAASLVLIEDGTKLRSPFDLLGFLYSGLGFALFMSGLEAVSRGAGVTFSAGMLLAGGILLALAVHHIRRVKQPLFNLSPLAIPSFRITFVGGSLFRTAISTAPFLLPLLFEVGFGYSPVKSGALLLWLFAGNLGMKPATTWLMNRFGFRNVLLVNGVLVALGFVAIGWLKASSLYSVAAGLLFLNGAARSMQFTALSTVGFAEIPQKEMRDATTLYSVMQQVNSGLGIAVGALLLSIAQWVHHTRFSQATPADFQLAFWIIGGISLLGNVDLLFLDANVGSAVLTSRTSKQADSTS